jgi:hypothetical protein
MSQVHNLATVVTNAPVQDAAGGTAGAIGGSLLVVVLIAWYLHRAVEKNKAKVPHVLAAFTAGVLMAGSLFGSIAATAGSAVGGGVASMLGTVAGSGNGAGR